MVGSRRQGPWLVSGGNVMTRIAISLALFASLPACTDSSESTMGGPGAQPGKPLHGVVQEQPMAYQGNDSIAETMPELPDVTLLHEGNRVLVLSDEGTVLCAIEDAAGTKLDAAAVAYACGDSVPTSIGR